MSLILNTYVRFQLWSDEETVEQATAFKPPETVNNWNISGKHYVGLTVVVGKLSEVTN